MGYPKMAKKYRNYKKRITGQFFKREFSKKKGDYNEQDY